MNLGDFSVWQPAYAATPEMAKRIEGLGYTALWLGGPAPDVAGIDELLAAERYAGSVPYLVTPEHTRRARAALGPQGLLAPEQKVVLESDPDRARALARPRIKHPYLGLVNYTNNLRRLGFTDEDLAGDGSDGLIDQFAVHGDAAAVARAPGGGGESRADPSGG